MSRHLFYLSVLSLTLSACSNVDSKLALGDFDYVNKQESKDLIVPQNLDKPINKKEFFITDKINHQGSIGDKVDIRAPSLVLPIAASSRVIAESDEAIIWFDQSLEEKDLLALIQNAVVQQLMIDEVGYEVVESYSQDEEKGNRQSKTEIYESDWYHNEVETGWLFIDVESTTSLRFRYKFFVKPHGRSVSLQVSLIDYLKTDNKGGSKTIEPIDQQRAEMVMLNKIVAQVDQDYRLHEREARLLRANQQLVSIGENKQAESAYIVEMSLDKLWSNMPFFFEKYGFTINDLNETNKVYYVTFAKPEVSLWDTIWGDDRPVIDVRDAKYQFVLEALDEKEQKTSVSIYDTGGNSLPLETLKRVFPVMEKALSFREQ